MKNFTDVQSQLKVGLSSRSALLVLFKSSASMLLCSKNYCQVGCIYLALLKIIGQVGCIYLALFLNIFV